MCWWLSCICFLCWYPVISFSGFKRNQWSWGPFATEIFPSPFGTSLGPAIWWDYIWRNRRLNSLHVPWWEGHTLWDTVARSPQSLWTTHLRLLSIKDISSQYWSGHISSKWHFVNRERRKKKKLWFLCLQGLALEVLGFIFSCCFFLFICLNKFTATRVGCGWSAQTLYAPLASRMLAEMLWACVMLAWQHFQCHC